MEWKLLPGMKLGAASAAGQIEGGDLAHNWNDWADKGHIKDGTSPRRANDHWNRWREDVDLMRAMGLQVYRLGVEWARVEPREGAFDMAAVEQYRALLRYIKEQGIKPLVTLHHFVNPLWFEERGAFTKAENIPAFMNYVNFIVGALGDLIEEYITINEPNVYATLGYFGGGFPPGENRMGRAVTVMSVLAACHIKSYRVIHELHAARGFGTPAVGFAHHMRAFAPKNPRNPWHRFCAGVTARMFQTAVSRALLTGRFVWPLHNVAHLPRGEYADFLGLNYYTRSQVSKIGDGTAEHGPKNDLGWEIYPEGIVQCARALYAVLPRPIYITENGTCDNADAFRARYIHDHLMALCESGLPVTRYYHWCFTDNFEWLEGESARFGLVHVDYDTQQRTVKASGQFFSALIRDGGVTEAVYDAFVAPTAYHA